MFRGKKICQENIQQTIIITTSYMPYYSKHFLKVWQASESDLAKKDMTGCFMISPKMSSTNPDN